MAIEEFYVGLGVGVAVLGIGSGIGLGYLLSRWGRSKELSEMRHIIGYRIRTLEALKEKLDPEELKGYVDNIAPLPGDYHHD